MNRDRVVVHQALLRSMPPNGLELTGDGGAAAGVRCSDLLGAAIDYVACEEKHTRRQEVNSYRCD